MRISKICVKNYRLLKDFSVNVDHNFSLIVGKNNTGKTSLLNILQKFQNGNSNYFNFEDFSIECQKEISKIIEKKGVPNSADCSELKIQLKIYIERDDKDDLSNISDLILDLDPNNKTLLICYEYFLNYEKIPELREEIKNVGIKNTIDFLKKRHKTYFNIKKYVIDTSDSSNFIEVEDSQIKKVINIKAISAKRDVLNTDGDSLTGNKTLSKLSYRYFKPIENTQSPHVVSLQSELIKADGNLTKSYEGIFQEVTKDIEQFSYNGSKVSVRSNFQEINLLKENTVVGYDEDGHHLPEDYNGLGYMNLFAMIFELHIIFDEFSKVHEKGNPAEINLLFIEEPEAHTHPQLQYVFIKNIKQLLKKHGKDLNLQTIITTHSAHIVSQSDFKDIKYFINKDKNIVSKDLCNLEGEYVSNDQEKEEFKFLKQYLTLNGSELFFSDKIIFIEGDTERILLPAFMKKVDESNKTNSDYIPLLSQKISVIEVGAYSKVFSKLLAFLEIKTLIITDLDSIDSGRIKCKVSVGVDTSNSSIKHFLPNKSFSDLVQINKSDRLVKLGNTNVYICFQTSEKGYHARSFEDAFISINIDFIKKNETNFNSIGKNQILNAKTPDFYEIAQQCIGKKTDFATDVLYYGDEFFNDWQIPEYIKEGLIWIANK